MSTTPIVIETIMPLGQIQAGQQALRDLGPAADVASTGFHNAAAASSEFDQEINYVNTQNIRARASFDEAAAGATEFGYSLREARGSARLLAEEVGLHLNRELSNSLARSATLGPLLEKAFSALAIVGFIQILAEVPAAFDKIIGKITDWDEAAKKRYEDEVKQNYEAIAANLKYQKSLDDNATIGKEGIAKIAVEQQNLTNEQARIVQLQSGFSRSVIETQDEVDALTERSKGWLGVVENAARTWSGLNRISGISEQLDKDEKALTNLRAEQQKYANELTANAAERARATAESAADRLATERQEQNAEVDAVRSGNLARAAAGEEYVKLQYETHHISLTEELDELKDFENQKLDAEKVYTANRVTLLRSQFAKGEIGDPSAEITKINQDLEDKEAAHDAKIKELDTQISQTQIKLTLETATEKINANERVQESTLHLAEVTQKAAFSKAESPAELEAAAIPYIKTVTELYDQQIQAKRDLAQASEQALTAEQRPTAGLGTDAFSKQLETIKEVQPEIFKQLTELNAEVVVLQNEQAGAVLQIEQEKTEKTEALNATTLENQKTVDEGKLSADRASYERSTEALKLSLDQKHLSLSNYVQEADALAQGEYAKEVEIYQRELDAIRQMAAQKVITEQEATKRIEEIHNQEQQSYQQMLQREESALRSAVEKEQQEIKQATQRISQDFTQAFNQIITGHEKVGQAALKLGQELELYIIDQGIKKVVTHYATELLQMLASHSSFLASLLGIEAAGHAAQAAQAYTAAETQVMAEAAISYAAGFASTMAALPFPANIAAAPAIASEAAAETLAGMAFEHGGIVPGSSGSAVPIIAHAKEMVLPEHISSFIQSAAGAAGAAGAPGGAGGAGGPGGPGGSGGDNYNTTHNHNRFEINVDGQKTGKDEVIAWVQQGLQRGAFSR